jgi:hypothetical protein
VKKFLVEDKNRTLLGEFQDILDAMEFCTSQEDSLVIRVVDGERTDMTYRIKARQNFTK